MAKLKIKRELKRKLEKRREEMFKKLVVVLLLILSLVVIGGCGEEEKESSNSNQQNSNQQNPFNGTWKGYYWSSVYNSGIGNVVIKDGNFSISGTALNFCGSGSTGVGYVLSGSVNTAGVMSNVKLTGALSPSGTSGTGACVNNECWVRIDFYPCGTFAYTSLWLQLVR